MSLDELLRALQDGESRAEKRLFQRLWFELLPFFKKRVDPNEVEDLSQQTLEIIARELKAKSFEPRGPTSFRSFTFIIAHYRLLSHRRDMRRRRRSLETPGHWVAAPELNPDEIMLIEQQATLLRAAMAAIRTRFRRALESRLLDEDPQEFADTEGIELGTVRTRVYRATVLMHDEVQARRKTPREQSPVPT